MGQAADLQDVALEQAAGVRVGDHDGRHVRTQLGGQVGHVDAAVVGLGYFHDRIADEGGGGRVGAVGRGRDQHLAALLMLALGFVGGADGHQAAQLAVRAGLGRQGHRRHPRQRRQPVGQLVHQLQRALNRRLRLQRVDVREARQARHLLVQARVVLHRARAQRIQRQVDGVVLLAQAHIVAHGLWLRQAGQADRILADQIAQV